MPQDEHAYLDDIRNWRSIITFVVFLLSPLSVLFPHHVPIYIPSSWLIAGQDALARLRILPRAHFSSFCSHRGFVRFRFPVNLNTGPLIGVLFLIATTAIGSKEVKEGTIGANNISPIDLVAFAVTLGYVSTSIDCTGIIRWLTYKVVRRNAAKGIRLFSLLYLGFFTLGCFFGNDPVILMGTSFLSYMVRLTPSITSPLAYVHTQFAVANIASAILVSSNTTNVVIAQAFNIKFGEYTVNVIVPVLVAAIVLAPMLLYLIFADANLIPLKIHLRELPERTKAKAPVSPYIPFGPHDVRVAGMDESTAQIKELEQLMNPYLDKMSATFGVLVMFTTLIVLLALTAANVQNIPVFWATLPASVIILAWDVGVGWFHRRETRLIASYGKEEAERQQMEMQTTRVADSSHARTNTALAVGADSEDGYIGGTLRRSKTMPCRATSIQVISLARDLDETRRTKPIPDPGLTEANRAGPRGSAAPYIVQSSNESTLPRSFTESDAVREVGSTRNPGQTTAVMNQGECVPEAVTKEKPTLLSVARRWEQWSRETFPVVTVVLSHLPWSLVLFVFPTFILVQSLMSTGWVTLLAHGWQNWIRRTGTVGAISGMGFISVILSNFAGTNIGTTVLLSRMLQVWASLAGSGDAEISQRDFWASVYALAIGVNYAAFSIAFSASLAGLGWRDDLKRQKIHVRGMRFAQTNLPIIAITMTVSSGVLVGQVYITRTTERYVPISPS